MALDPEVQRALQDISEELRELTQVMRQLGRTMSAIGDDEIRAFAGETAKASGSVQKLGQSARESVQLLDQHGRAIESATEATEDDTKATKENTESKKKLTREEFVYRRAQRSAFRDLAEEFSTTRGATARLQESFLGTMKGNEALQGGVLLVESLFRGLGQATVSLTQDIYAGQRGAAVSARAFNKLAQEVGTAAQGVGLALGAFSILGIFVPQLKLLGVTLGAVRAGFAALAGTLALFGITLKTAGELNEEAAKQNDQLFKSFNDLSRAGVGVVGGLDGLFDSLQSAGMSVAEIEQFTSLIASSTKQLAFLAPTTSEAARSFAQVAGDLRRSNLGEQLEMLGIQAEEQRELVMGYMSQQARLGRLERQSTAQLIEGSARYAKELDTLAQLTGASRKEQQDAREALMADERLRSAIVDARLRDDQQELDRLIQARELAAVARNAGSEQLATAIAQVAAAGGVLSTETAVMGEMTGRITEVLAMDGTLTQKIEALVGNLQENQRQLAGTNRIIGTIAGYQIDVTQVADVVDRLLPAILEAQKLGMPLEEFLEQERKLREQGDKSLQQNVQAGRMQQNAAQIMDSVLRSFNISATIHQTASKTFETAVNKFAETVGARPVAGGPLSVGGQTRGQAPSASSASFDTEPTGYVPHGSGAKPGDFSDIGARAFPQGAPHQRTAKALREAFVDPVVSAANAVGGFFSSMQDPKYRTEKPRLPDGDRESLRPEQVIQFLGGTSGNRRNFDQLEPSFRASLLEMAQKYFEQTGGATGGGKKLPFGSGQRSRIENAEVGGVANSRHISGTAVDLTADVVKELDGMGLLSAYGFQPNAKSPWHISRDGYALGGVIQAQPGGVPITVGEGQYNEAVVPLPDGKRIPVDMANFDRSLQAQTNMMSAQLARLDEVVTVMRNQLDVSQRILQVAQN